MAITVPITVELYPVEGVEAPGEQTARLAYHLD